MSEETIDLISIIVNATSASIREEQRKYNLSRLRFNPVPVINVLTSSQQPEDTRRRANKILDKTVSFLLDRSLGANISDRHLASNLLIDILTYMSSKHCFNVMAIRTLDRKLSTMHFWKGQPNSIRDNLQTIAILVDTLCVGDLNQTSKLRKPPSKSSGPNMRRLSSR